MGGLKVGDYIVEISGYDAKYFTQAEVLEKIRTSMNTLDLKIITPMQFVSKPVSIFPKIISFSNKLFEILKQFILGICF